MLRGSVGEFFNVAVSQQHKVGLKSWSYFILPAVCVLPPTVYRHVTEVLWRVSITHWYDYTSHLMLIYCVMLVMVFQVHPVTLYNLITCEDLLERQVSMIYIHQNRATIIQCFGCSIVLLMS